MNTVHPLPNEIAVKTMLSMLFGDDMVVEPGQEIVGNTVYASYLNDEDEPVCACLCDYHCAAFVGAALTRLPVDVAEEAADDGSFSTMMLGNLHETMNICSRLFISNDSPHIRLDKVYTTLEEVPDDVKALLDGESSRVDFKMEIPNYGWGAISMLAV